MVDNMEESNKEQYAIVELMGRKIVAGRISKSDPMFPSLLRVDVPATTAYPAYTQYYGESSIYCVTFVSEEVAHLMAESFKVNPVNVYNPDLITRTKHNEIVEDYRSEIESLRRGLPDPDDRGDADEEDRANF